MLFATSCGLSLCRSPSLPALPSYAPLPSGLLLFCSLSLSLSVSTLLPQQVGREQPFDATKMSCCFCCLCCCCWSCSCRLTILARTCAPTPPLPLHLPLSPSSRCVVANIYCKLQRQPVAQAGFPIADKLEFFFVFWPGIFVLFPELRQCFKMFVIKQRKNTKLYVISVLGAKKPFSM